MSDRRLHDRELPISEDARRQFEGDNAFQPEADGPAKDVQSRPASTLGTNTAQGRPVSQPLDTLDRHLRGSVSKNLGGVSPWAAMQAWEDWGYHMAGSPMRMMRLGLETAIAWSELTSYAALSAWTGPRKGMHEPDSADHRFEDEGWRRSPYSTFAQWQLMREHLWKLATEPLPGVRAHHMRRVWLMGMQILRATSPSNFAGMNPEVMREIEATGGRCLLKGARLFRDDLDVLVREGSLAKRMVHKLGTDIAASPGSVVFRNDLIELIQYAPSTDEVRREPILIVPAWIMKYYILDLAPENSLIRYLVSEGFTVFCISWRNPDADDRELCLEDYRRHGVMAAIDAVCDIVPDHRIHGVGYCLGGTMLAVAAAAMRRDGDDRLATMSLLAAQTDFAEAGELMMFTDESQISTLEDVMAVQGYLDAAQMSGAFYYLRANDLVWSRLVDRYLKGIDREVTDFDAWFTDPTRMPARMHSQYLRWLFLENRLAQGNYEADGEPVALKDIDLPVFALGAERDHIAPWRSVHKIGLFTGGETHFLLSGGGHNSAVVSPPGKPKAYYRQRTIGGCDFYIDPDNWVEEAAMESGSWWPVWRDWLSQRSEPAPIPARPIETDRILCDAPGTYVHQR